MEGPRSVRVGIVGTGRMGAAMAGRVAGAGFPLIVWNRDRSKAERVAGSTGAEVAGSARELASSADVILSSLADDAALRAAYLDGDGVVAGIREDAIAVDTSTVDPLTVAEIGAAIDAAGGGFLDCPVSGSVSSVESGALTIMAGGDPALLERVGPVLGTISQRVIHVGPRGAGSATKLAVNALVHGLNVALSEALVLAERAGVAREVAYEVFASGAGGAPFVQYKRAAYEHPDDAPVAFSLDLVEKDLELITGLAARVGAPMRQAGTTLSIVREAVERGYGDRDLSAVAAYLREEVPA